MPRILKGEVEAVREMRYFQETKVDERRAALNIAKRIGWEVSEGKVKGRPEAGSKQTPRAAYLVDTLVGMLPEQSMPIHKSGKVKTTMPEQVKKWVDGWLATGVYNEKNAYRKSAQYTPEDEREGKKHGRGDAREVEKVEKVAIGIVAEGIRQIMNINVNIIATEIENPRTEWVICQNDKPRGDPLAKDRTLCVIITTRQGRIEYMHYENRPREDIEENMRWPRMTVPIRQKKGLQAQIQENLIAERMVAVSTTHDRLGGAAEEKANANGTAVQSRLAQIIIAATAGIVVPQSCMKEFGINFERVRAIANKTLAKGKRGIDSIAETLKEWKLAIEDEPESNGQIIDRVMSVGKVVTVDTKGIIEQIGLGAQDSSGEAIFYRQGGEEEDPGMYIPLIRLPKGMDYRPWPSG